MPDERTELTEIMTGVGMLGGFSVRDAMETPPDEFVNLDHAVWDSVVRNSTDPRFERIAEASFANGAAFLASDAGLRGRVPLRVEWKGPHRNPGSDPVPVDLRVDHVYLISCKYQSKVLVNASPANVFIDLLDSPSGGRSGNWFEQVAPHAHQVLYQAVRTYLGEVGLPDLVSQLDRRSREVIKREIERTWPEEVLPAYLAFVSEVSNRTADVWRTAIVSRLQAERLLWRLLRIGPSPYFLLGTTGSRQLRLRVGTAWDFRQDFELKNFEVVPQDAGQPTVGWSAEVFDKRRDLEVEVCGHVEVRWSHGRFSGVPEAKVYLDTGHTEVTGYYAI